jgi:uncharacterized integral membrane protein
MRVFKLLVSLIILCLVGLFIYQNMETWKQLIQFRLNLYFYNPSTSPGVELYMIIVLSALAGFIVGLAAMMKPFFKTRRLLKRERQEKKQAEEALTTKQADEPHGEALSPANQAE